MKVDLGKRSYTIHIDEDDSRIVSTILSCKGAVIITDSNIYEAQSAFFAKLSCPMLILEPGENTKSVSFLEKIWYWLSSNLDRQGTIFAIGGGVIGDLVGFAAASYMRGVNFYQVPTTLLACVDSSVGGKTGINLESGKNLVGAFWQPKGVLLNTAFLHTLPKREYAEAFGEIIKYGLIADSELFELLEKSDFIDAKHPLLNTIIEHSIAIKAKIVSEDELETQSGKRVLLNLGHTFGHAIESVAGYGKYMHGEAVSVGLCMASELSGLSATDLKRVRSLCEKYSLPTTLSAPLSCEKLIEKMWQDKKADGDKITFVLLNKIGKAHTSDDVDFADVEKLWHKYGAN